MEFQNKINQLYFEHDQEPALTDVRETMLNMEIFIIENSDLFVEAAQSNEEMHLARFCFNEDDENLVSDEKLH